MSEYVSSLLSSSDKSSKPKGKLIEEVTPDSTSYSNNETKQIEKPDNYIETSKQAEDQEISLMDLMIAEQAKAAILVEKRKEEDKEKAAGFYGPKGFKKGFLSDRNKNNQISSLKSFDKTDGIIDVRSNGPVKQKDTKEKVIEDVKSAVREEQEKHRREEEEKFPILKNLRTNG